jgi:DNA modification methylase
MVIGNSDYHWTPEPILYCGLGKERPEFYGDRANRTVMETIGDVAKLPKEKLIEIVESLKDTLTTLRVRKDTQHYQHPTQKPVGILTPLIKNSTAVEDIVVDLFAGSGSTLISAEQLGRYAYCMEFSPAFVDVIRKRYAKFIGKEDNWEEFTKEL